MSPIAEALYNLAVEEGNTVTLEAIRNAALNKIMGGEAKSLVSSSVNGKSFSFSISKPADQIFSEASQAIIAFRGGRSSSGQPDFSGI